MNDVAAQKPKLSLTEQHEDTSVSDLMQLINNASDKQMKKNLSQIVRQKMAKEERDLANELKKEAEDSKEEKRLLKKTQIDLMEARKSYLAAYRSMNNIMNSKSMLKHLDEFTDSVTAFRMCDEAFNGSLEAHIKNLRAIRSQDG